VREKIGDDGSSLGERREICGPEAAGRSCVSSGENPDGARSPVNGPYANHGVIITAGPRRALSAVIQSKFNGERIAIADKPYIQRET